MLGQLSYVCANTGTWQSIVFKFSSMLCHVPRSTSAAATGRHQLWLQSSARMPCGAGGAECGQGLVLKYGKLCGDLFDAEAATARGKNEVHCKLCDGIKKVKQLIY